jgi:hypothetical protein
MSSTLFEPPVRRSCWTAVAGLRHCEGFRVVGPRGPMGYVEEVVLDEAEDVAGLKVYGRRRRRTVFVRDILWLDVAAEVVRLRRDAG